VRPRLYSVFGPLIQKIIIGSTQSWMLFFLRQYFQEKADASAFAPSIKRLQTQLFYLLPNISSSFAVRDKMHSICLYILNYTYMVFARWVPGCASIFQVWETEGFVGNKLCSWGPSREHVLSYLIAVLQQEPSLGCVGQIYSLIAVLHQLHQGILLSQHDPTLIQ